MSLTPRSDIRAFAAYGGDFHSDHSFEANPPAYTLLRLVRTPETGGDTIFTSQTALFDKLSPSFQTLFEGLRGLHTSEQGYVNSINRGVEPFRGPVRREHPFVRTHPVTRVKSLFYNPAFVLHLEGLKGAEAAHALNFLREYVPFLLQLHKNLPSRFLLIRSPRHLHAADDITVRWKWEPGSVAFWDNRVVAHRAVPGGYNPEEREGKRTAIFGEKPFFDPKNSLSLSEWDSKASIKHLNGNGENVGP